MAWLNTKAALAEIEKILGCGHCGLLVDDPCTLGSCEHFFCSSCTKQLAGNSCPKCGMPAHARDIQTDRQVERAAKLCLRLNRILHQNDSGPLSASQCSTPTTRGRSTVEAPSVVSSVYSLHNSPEATSPVARRTRKVEVNKDLAGTRSNRRNLVVETNQESNDTDNENSENVRPTRSKQKQPVKKGNTKKKKLVGKQSGQDPEIVTVDISDDESLPDVSKSLSVSNSEDKSLQIATSASVSTGKVAATSKRKVANSNESTAENIEGRRKSLRRSQSPSAEDNEEALKNEEGNNATEKCNSNRKAAKRKLGKQSTTEEKKEASEPGVGGRRSLRRNQSPAKDAESLGNEDSNDAIEECEAQNSTINRRTAKRMAGKQIPTDEKENTSGSGRRRSLRRCESPPAGHKQEEANNEASRDLSERSKLPNSKISHRTVRHKSERQSEPNQKENTSDPEVSISAILKDAWPSSSPVETAKNSSNVRKSFTSESAGQEEAKKPGARCGTRRAPQRTEDKPEAGQDLVPATDSRVNEEQSRAESPLRRRKVASTEGLVTKSSPATLKLLTPKRGRPVAVVTPQHRRVQGSPLPVSPLASPASQRRNAKGETPLHIAAIKGDVHLVRSLLEDGAVPNVKDNAGWTPLHESCNHGHHEIASLLLDNGALINVPGMDNDTPLHDAVQNGRLECARLLVQRGASVNARNLNGLTPLHLARTAGMRAVLETPVDLDTSTTSIGASPAFSGPNQIVLLTTGLTREQKVQLQKCASVLHAESATEFSNRVTHLVSAVNAQGMCPRTLKYLQAVLLGTWIVNLEWLQHCLENDGHVSEEPFEVPGASTSPDSLAPMKGRENAQNQLPGLFDGCHFYLQGDFSYPTPEKHEVSQFIKLGGGVMLSREPKLENIHQSEVTVPYHADPQSEMASCSHYIIHDIRDKKATLIGPRLCSAPASWLLDCIAYFKLDLIHT